MVRDLEATESSDNPLAFLVVLPHEQPSRAVRQEEHAGNDNDTEEALERNWEPPDQVSWSIRSSIVKPVCNHGAKGNNTSFDTNQQSSVGRL